MCLEYHWPVVYILQPGTIEKHYSSNNRPMFSVTTGIKTLQIFENQLNRIIYKWVTWESIGEIRLRKQVQKRKQVQWSIINICVNISWLFNIRLRFLPL